MNLDVASKSSPVGYGGAPFAVLLLHVGGPVGIAEVRPYLDQRMRDQESLSVGLILRAPFLGLMNWMQSRRLQRQLLALPRPPEFRVGLARSAGGVETRLRMRGRDATVRSACRYVEPRLEPTLVELYGQGLRRLMLVFLHAQSSTVTTGRIWRQYRHAASQSGCVFRATAIESWYADGRYLGLMAETLEAALATIDTEERADARVLFCADGVPEANTPEDERYLEQVDATIQGIIARLPQTVQWGRGFHAASTLQRWVRPDIDAAVRALAETGGRHLVCMPLAVHEQLESLHELDVQLMSTAARVGFDTVHRVPALNDHAAFLDFMADLVEKKLTAE